MSPRSVPVVGAPIRVALVDASRRQREGWAMLIGSQPDLVVAGQAGSAAQALTLVRREVVDVVLIDIRLPLVDGFTVAGRIRDDARVRAHGRAPRIILFATLDLDDQVPAAASAGAYAVLYKGVEPEALLAAVREAAAAEGES